MENKESKPESKFKERLKDFIEAQEDIPVDIQKVINDRFWDMIVSTSSSGKTTGYLPNQPNFEKMAIEWFPNDSIHAGKIRSSFIKGMKKIWTNYVLPLIKERDELKVKLLAAHNMIEGMEKEIKDLKVKLDIMKDIVNHYTKP